MEGYDPATYGDRFADVYDDWYGDDGSTNACIEAVASRARRSAGDGRTPRVLELGAGTGRLAIPLAAAGLDVVALDSSTAMLDRLTSKPYGEQVSPVVGDMAGPLPEGPFDVVLVARNTFFNLTSEDAQRRCTAAVVDVLAAGGAFVVEAFVPSEEGSAPRSSVEVRRIEADRVLLFVDRHDPVAGEAWSSFVDISSDGIRLRPCHVRYLSPTALDRLVADGGLTLDDRCADWDGGRFDDDSTHHVSWYGRAG